MRDDAVEKLLSLFTSSDRAAAIAGDLVEERERHGWTWFWLHVVRVTCALWRNSVAEPPGQTLALTLVASVMMIVPALAGTASVGLFPQWLGSPINWMTLSFFWWGSPTRSSSATPSPAKNCTFLVHATPRRSAP